MMGEPSRRKRTTDPAKAQWRKWSWWNRRLRGTNGRPYPCRAFEPQRELGKPGVSVWLA